MPAAIAPDLKRELTDAEREIDSLNDQLCDAEEAARDAKREGEAIATHLALELCRDLSRGVFTLDEVLSKLEQEV